MRRPIPAAGSDSDSDGGPAAGIGRRTRSQLRSAAAAVQSDGGAGPAVLGVDGLPARTLTAQELADLEAAENSTLRQLRMYLRDINRSMLRDREFFYFHEPVDLEEVPDYADVIKRPMDLSTTMDKLNAGEYETPGQFLADIEQIRTNAYAYNANEGRGKKLLVAASAMLDHATHLIEEAQIQHGELLRECERIAESRRRRRTA